MARIATKKRTTKETDIEVTLNREQSDRYWNWIF